MSVVSPCFKKSLFTPAVSFLFCLLLSSVAQAQDVYTYGGVEASHSSYTRTSESARWEYKGTELEANIPSNGETFLFAFFNSVSRAISLQTEVYFNNGSGFQPVGDEHSNVGITQYGSPSNPAVAVYTHSLKPGSYQLAVLGHTSDFSSLGILLYSITVEAVKPFCTMSIESFENSYIPNEGFDINISVEGNWETAQAVIRVPFAEPFEGDISVNSTPEIISSDYTATLIFGDHDFVQLELRLTGPGGDTSCFLNLNPVRPISGTGTLRWINSVIEGHPTQMVGLENVELSEAIPQSPGLSDPQYRLCIDEICGISNVNGLPIPPEGLDLDPSTPTQFTFEGYYVCPYDCYVVMSEVEVESIQPPQEICVEDLSPVDDGIALTSFNSFSRRDRLDMQKGSKEAILEFDLLSIPADAQITSAELSVHVSLTSCGSLDSAYALFRAFPGDGVASFLDSLTTSAFVGSISEVCTLGRRTVTLSPSIVENFLDHNRFFGIVGESGSGRTIGFYSSRHQFVSNRPKLKVCYLTN